MTQVQKFLAIAIAPVFCLVIFGVCIFVMNGLISAEDTGFDVTQSLYSSAYAASTAESDIASKTSLTAAPNDASPVLVEMFLSQSCSSCVPAAQFVNDLTNRKDVVVLSWHVDYWDDLSVFNHGKWKDPYSNRAFTNRQSTYKINSATRRIYTPQAIINGTIETVGSRRKPLENAIIKNHDQTPSMRLSLSHSGTTLTATLEGAENLSNYEASLVFFHHNTQTSILGGENAGQEWTEANVVKTVRNFSKNTTMFQTQLNTVELSDDTGCAVIVQEANLGKVIAASYCPTL